jgi:outer membrane lipoprotein carrier protein
MKLIRPTVALAIAALALPAAAQTPAATLDRAAKAFKEARSVRASFEQTLKNPMTGTEARAVGELLLDQPNRLAVTFTRPAGDRIVSDGRWLWVYLPSSAPNQVLKLPAKDRALSGVDMVSELLTAPASRYRIADGGSATVGGRATHAVVLTPKAEGGPIERATLSSSSTSQHARSGN